MIAVFVKLFNLLFNLVCRSFKLLRHAFAEKGLQVAGGHSANFSFRRDRVECELIIHEE